MIVSARSLTLPSRLASTAIRLTAAVLLPLGLLGVTSALAQEPAKTVDPGAAACEARAKEVKAAVAAGTLTERQGVERIAACSGVAASKNADALPTKAPSGNPGPIDQLRRNIKDIQAGIDAGTIPADEGKAKIAEFTKQINDRLAQNAKAVAPKTAGQCAEIEQKIKVAVEAGTITAAEGRAKIDAECKNIGG